MDKPKLLRKNTLATIAVQTAKTVNTITVVLLAPEFRALFLGAALGWEVFFSTFSFKNLPCFLFAIVTPPFQSFDGTHYTIKVNKSNIKIT